MHKLILNNPKTDSDIIMSPTPGITDKTVMVLPVDSGTLLTVEELKETVISVSSEIVSNVTYIEAPSITSPLTGTTDYIGLLTATDMVGLSNFSGDHTATDWQFSLASDFSTIDGGTMNDNINLTSYPFSPAQHNTTYYVRCRYHSHNFMSPWSNAIAVTSSESYVTVPEISMMGDPANSGLNPEFSITPYSVTNGSDVVVSATWQISTDVNFINVVEENTILSTDDIGVYNTVTTLDINTTYYVRAKFKGIKYESLWSNTCSITTDGVTATPVLSGPTTATEKTSVSINILNYNRANSYKIYTNTGTVTSADGVITWMMPAVDIAQTITLSVTAKDIINNLPVSDAASITIAVTPLLVTADQVLNYTLGNFAGVVARPTVNAYSNNDQVSIYDNNLHQVKHIDVMDKSQPSTTNNIYVNNMLCEPKAGDVFTTDKNELFTVETVNKTGNDVVLNAANYFKMGNSYCNAVKPDGFLYGLGKNAYGQIGNIAFLNSSRFVNTTLKPKKVYTFWLSTAIILEDDSLWLTGYNVDGQLGFGDTTNRTGFTNTGIKASDVLCVGAMSFVKKIDGTYVCAGTNIYGQFGNGTTTSSTSWIVSTVIPATALKTGFGLNSGYYLTSDNKLYGFGDNRFGQLGLGDTTNRTIPTLIADGISDFVAGTYELFVKKQSDNNWYATGRNDFGQLGLGDTTSRTSLTLMTMQPDGIITGDGNNAIYKNGYIYVAGANEYGQLGTGDTVNKTSWTKIDVPSTNFGLSRYNSYYIAADGSVYVCGDNTYGQLGRTGITKSLTYIRLLGKAGTYNTAVSVTPKTTLTNIPNALFSLTGRTELTPETQDVSDKDFSGVYNGGMVEYSNIDVIDNTNQSTSKMIYINNKYIDLKENDQLITDTGEIINVAGVYDDSSVSEISPIKKIVSTNWGSLCLKENGEVWMAGNNVYGGAGDIDKRYHFGFQFSGHYAKDIFKTHNNTLILKDDNSLWGCGYNYFSGLGLGHNKNVFEFTKLADNVVQAATGWGHTAILKTDGYVYTAGYNAYGQLGTGDTTNRLTFVNTGVKAVSLACGDNHTVIIKSDGTVWSTGHNGYGELGLGDTANRFVFTNTGIVAKMVQCSLGSTYIVKSNDSLWGCGYNAYGQLGLGDTTNRTSFVSLGISASNIYGGVWSIVVKKTDGTYVCAGENAYNRLGLGDAVASVNTWTNFVVLGTLYDFFQIPIFVTTDGLVTYFKASLHSYLGLPSRNITGDKALYKIKPFLGKYKSKYWIVPQEELKTIPINVYPMSSVYANDKKVKIKDATYAYPYVYSTLDTAEFTAPARDVKVVLETPATNSVTNLSIGLSKLS